MLERPVYRLGRPRVRIVRHTRREIRAAEQLGFRSQDGQDKFVFEEFFRDGPTSGVFVDVGANDPIVFNNTLFFERQLGWRGIAIDPLPRYAERWRNERRAEYVCVAATSRETVLQLDEVEPGTSLDMYSSVRGWSRKHARLASRTREVRGRPLSAVLRDHGIEHVDLLSLDIEGHELEALSGIDFDFTTIDVAIIENNEPLLFGSSSIRDFMRGHGFVHHARIWQRDDVFVRPAFLEQGPRSPASDPISTSPKHAT